MSEVDGSVIAREYRRRMQSEIADVEARSTEAGKIDEMRTLRRDILNHLTAKVISDLAAAYGIAIEAVQRALAVNPIQPSEGDPFENHRGPGHLLD